MCQSPTDEEVDSFDNVKQVILTRRKAIAPTRPGETMEATSVTSKNAIVHVRS